MFLQRSSSFNQFRLKIICFENISHNRNYFQVIPIGDPIPAVSADYSQSSEDRLFNLLGNNNRLQLPSLSKPSFNLFSGGKKPSKSKGRPSYKAPGSRPKPAYNSPNSRPSYKAPSSGYGVPKAPVLSSSYGVPQAPPVGYGVPQGPALSSNYRAPTATAFSTPQNNNNNNNLNGFATQDSYSSQKRPNRDSLQVSEESQTRVGLDFVTIQNRIFKLRTRFLICPEII